jgi:hypothetical protein
MAYTEAAKERRRCTGTRKDGEPCRAWAVWGDPRQLCAQHAGHGARGPRGHSGPPFAPYRRAAAPPCTCPAYNWPHRPGGGLCRWPDPPIWSLTTPAGTHSDLYRLTRSRTLARYKQLMRRRYG